MKVFLSSTYIDLIEHRKAAHDALEQLGLHVIRMEAFGARPEESTKACLKEVEDSDLFVGIYAHRYGYIPDGKDVSITEQEFIHAQKSEKPIFGFVIDEDHLWHPKHIEHNKKTNLDAFLAKVKTQPVEFFTTPDNLAQKIASSIGRYLAERKAEEDARQAAIHVNVGGDFSGNLTIGDHNNSNINQSSTSAKPTGNTLPNQEFFVGRDKERDIILSALSSESRTWGALIDGPGGIGKSALAIHAAHKAEGFERKIFITAKVRELTAEGEAKLTDFTRPTYLAMLDELGKELGADGLEKLAPDERPNELRLALAGKKALIIFDNLETLPEEERTRLFQFLSRLPTGNKVIVTSRRRTDVDARIVRLDRLARDEALQLIAELAAKYPRLARASQKEREDLYKITQGNPLFIRWIAGQLGREGSQCRTIAEACAFIDTAPKGNDPLEYIFGDLLETFTADETRVLAALTHFIRPAKLMWVVEITGLVEKITKTVLDDLTDRSILIADNEFSEFFLPPLASRFIKTHRPQAVADTGEILSNRAYKLIEMYSGKTNYDGYKVLNNEWLSIEAAIPALLSKDEKNGQLFRQALEKFFRFTGRYDEAIEIYSQAELKAFLMDNVYEAGWCAFDLGWIYYLRGESRYVMNCANRADTLWGNAGNYEKSFSALLRGMGYKLENNYSEALKYIQESINLRKSTIPTSQETAVALNDLAQLERMMGNLDAAEAHYQEALQIDKLNDSHEGIATRIGNLAELALDRKEWSKAKDLACTSLEMAEKIGRQELIAKNSRRIALALYNQGDLLEALPLAQRAFDIFLSLRYKDLEKAKETLLMIKHSAETQSR